MDVARGMGYLHSQGILHLAIKLVKCADGEELQAGAGCFQGCTGGLEECSEANGGKKLRLEHIGYSLQVRLGRSLQVRLGIRASLESIEGVTPPTGSKHGCCYHSLAGQWELQGWGIILFLGHSLFNTV